MEDDRIYEPMEDTPGEKLGRIVKSTVKWLFLIAVILFFGTMFLRMCLSEDTAKAKRYLWTDESAALYAADPAAYEVYEMKLTDNYSEMGYFYTDNERYAPAAKEFQFTVRYNDSTLRYLMEKYGISEAELPEEPFLYVLSDGSSTWTAYGSLSDHRALHNYRRLIFTGVEVTEATGALTLSIYYAGDLSEAYASLDVYRSTTPVTAYKLKKNELPGADSGMDDVVWYQHDPEMLG